MRKFKKGDVVMVGERGTKAWCGKWPWGAIVVIEATISGSKKNNGYPFHRVSMNSKDNPFAFFFPEELHYIGRL